MGALTITASDMYDRIAFLASDELRGRATPSPGLDSAAAYLVREYERLGLRPGGEDGTYYQRFPLPLLALDTASVHLGTLVNGRDNQMLEYGRDFYVAPVAAADTAGMGHARVVYVGSLAGGELPPGEYADAAPLVTVPGDYSRAWRAGVSAARASARAAGARALIVAVAPDFPARRFRSLAASSREPVRRLADPQEIPVFYLTAAAAEALVARGGQTLASLPRSAPAPVSLRGVEAHFAATARDVDPNRAPNVVAILPGSDPRLRDEYVVLSAHLDHVGVGNAVDGDSIYNGADDDASGTSALVEVAEALASLPERPRRSVVFLHVSGEEKGLVGSKWFTDHPTVPLEDVVANVNVDMIGRNSPDSIVVIGKEYSSLGATANAVQARHPELHLALADDVWPEERFFFRSDHFNFARKEIPALFFFSGTHEDYHRPSDEVDRIDVDKAARVARMIYYSVQAIADADSRPRWDPAGLREVRGMRR